MSGPQAGGGWCEVGPHGKHKHVPRHQQEPGCQHLLFPHFTHQPPDAVGISDRKELQDVFSLTLLPDTALACIFQNLDSSSAFSLAQTCRACAEETMMKLARIMYMFHHFPLQCIGKTVQKTPFAASITYHRNQAFGGAFGMQRGQHSNGQEHFVMACRY
ncbi:hypothetical protein WJX82_002758 [Trebouxia sp. C0006]